MGLIVSACGGGVGPGGRLVGGQCSTDNDCVKRCVRNRSFPGGLCSLSCNSERDCPGGTTCINSEGGVCAIVCLQVADCAPFGAGYSCDATDRRGDGGQALVCRVP
jgi:hypothetical protein